MRRHSVSLRPPPGQGLPLGVSAGTLHLPRALPGHRGKQMPHHLQPPFLVILQHPPAGP